ncbi:peptidase G2 autoproteolytic cleavage domain-containing protein [uncultured Ruminococcus sp.]|uniref:peptidase G2 autoproteolytic cleavage domain-containing protein n=1 Tax=uncultured Ruminococcus sp. TaxID=165186 RepID=UPI002676CADC|nr:peptidase G2 autoproteolytic cleavage domain-containing protein [uncultured Ruminococcus sp.]
MALEEHAELVVKTKSGESYTIAESRIVKGSLTASSSCSSGGGIPAGACNIGTASVAFRAPSGLTYKKLYRAKVEIYAWYQGYSKELYGTYNVSSAENNYGVYTLSLSDNISLLDESCYAANDTENAENWLYSQMAGRWNVPSVILNYICNAYNVPHYNAAENEKYVPDSGNTALATGVSSECSVESVKDFANYLAEYLGCFIAAAPDGRMRFSRLGEREYKTELNQSNISRGTLQRSPYYVHPSIWKVSFDSGYGSSWYVSSDLPDDAAPLSINITNNPFWQVQEDRVPADIYGGKVTQMIKYMWDYLYNAAVRKDGNTVEYMINPFSCTVHVPYHFRIGDIVTVRDYVNGDVFRSYLTDITWTFRGGQQISCAGDDTRTLSVGTSRSAAKKSNDYSKYLYRKSKTGSSGGDTNTYTKAEIDAKDASVRSAADKAQETADGAVSVNNTQNTQIAALQKSAHAHSNKDVLDKTEQPYTTAERDKLAGLGNYVHPAHTAYNKGMYKVAVDDEGHVTEAETMTKEDIYNAGGVIQSELTFQDYIGDIPLAFMTLFYGGGLRNIAEIGFDRRDDDGKRNFSLKLGGWQDKSTGRLDLVDYIGCQYTITPDPNNSYGTQHYYYVLPAGKSGTIALTSDIPDISEKQDKLTAGTNITISGNTISAKDTTYGNASASAAGLMSAADKTNLDANTAARHTHANNSILDQLNEEQWKIINGAANKAHVHDNKAVLDKTTASYTTAEKTKLAGIADGANKYAHPTTSGNKHIPSGGSSGQILRWSADGTAVWGADNNTTYNDATQSTHGLMTAADKKKLDGMDSSKYLPKSGGVMTGDIDMQTNKRDILVGTHKANTSDGTAVAGGTINTDKTFAGMLPAMRSYIGTYQYKTSSAEAWYALISVRHRNGYSDGSSWGMIIYANLFGGNLQWNLNTNKDVWQGGRTLLDSANFTDYALGKSATASAASKLSTARKINTIAFDGTADIVIPRSTKYMNASSGTGGQTGYVKVATFTVKSQYTNMPTVVRYRNRHTMPVELIFRFKNQSKVDPELEFILQVVELTDYGYKEAYLYKSATSTWDLIIAKSEAWDSVQILDCQQADGVSVAFENTHVSTVPSTAIKATVYERAMVTSTVAAATKLNTARTLTIGNTGKTFDGSANVSWSLDEIGVLGRNTKGMTYKLKNVSYNGSATDYIFNDYSANQAGGGEYITVTGSQNIALGGNCIFLAGWRNTAQGHQCAAMGQENIVAGTANIALGCGNQVTADATGGLSLGNYNTCKANASLSGGWYTEIQKSSNQSIGYGNHVTVATASCAAFGAYNGYSFSGPYLSLGNGTESARANAFRAAAAGVYSSGSYHSSGADYAEYFEWLDGNLNNEDRRGRFVKLDGEKILLAESVEDDILGVVSGNPSVIGDSYEDQWRGQYMTDIYGEPLTEDYTDEDGTTRKVWVLNPDYNPDKPYVPRSDRQEWSAVGMMGKLIVIDDGTCRPNDYCVPTTGGIATRSERRVGYRVLSRIDDTHIKVLIRG